MAKVIMTAEDSRSVRQAVTLILEQAGYRVVAAVDGVDALERLRDQRIDMLLTDLNMPRMDGYELIRQVRALKEYRFIPIVTLTTETQLKKKIEGKKAGATGWIVKPFKPDKLIAVIKKVLRD